MQLILASGSPRRKKLLEIAQFHFHTDPVKISEIIKENLRSEDILKDLARQKAQAYLRQRNSSELEGKLLLTADTMVLLDGKQLGKPQNETQAVEFLNNLSSNTHSVMTGICLYDAKSGQWAEEVCETKIEFKALSESQILEYVESGEPMDKAGAYGIQGKGGEFIKSISGSWTNVVGLPMELLDEMLKKNNWDIPRKIKSVDFKSHFDF